MPPFARWALDMAQAFVDAINSARPPPSEALQPQIGATNWDSAVCLHVRRGDRLDKQHIGWCVTHYLLLILAMRLTHKQHIGWCVTSYC